jgi:hypothetical protein
MAPFPIRHIGACVPAFMVCGSAFACSGSGTREDMLSSLEFGYGAGFVVSVLAAISYIGARITHGRALLTAILAMLAIIHPGWYISPYSGDCGMMRNLFTFADSSIAITLFIIDACHWIPKLGKRPH